MCMNVFVIASSTLQGAEGSVAEKKENDGKVLKKSLFVGSWALSHIIKSFRLEISSVFSFRARELNLE